MISVKRIFRILVLVNVLTAVVFFFALSSRKSTPKTPPVEIRPRIAQFREPIQFRMRSFKTDLTKNRIFDPRPNLLEVKDSQVTQRIYSPAGELLLETTRPLNGWFWLQQYATESRIQYRGEQSRDNQLFQWFEAENSQGKLYQVLVHPESGLVREVVDDRGLGFELHPKLSSQPLLNAPPPAEGLP
jgi:hypothetical protein